MAKKNITDTFQESIHGTTNVVGRQIENKKKENLKTEIIAYGVFWVLIVIIAGIWSYVERTTGQSPSIGNIGSELSQFHILHFLNPMSWGTCIKWSVIYWIGIILFMVYEQRFMHDADGIESGSAIWNNEVEEYNETHNEPFGEGTFSDEPGLTKKMGIKNLNNPKTPPVPGNPNMIESMTVRLSTADMKTHVNNNVFIVGGAGTGKSRFFIKPNVLQMNCSYIVTDPSGELLKSMHNVLADNGYKIKVFNLVDMSYSNKYNPFNYVKTDTDVSILVDCFMSNTTGPDQKSGDPFWDKSEKALLSALIFYLKDIADEEFRKFSTVLWMVQLAQLDENGNRGSDNDDKDPVFNFDTASPLDELFKGTKKLSKKTIKSEFGEYREMLDIAAVTPEENKELRIKIEASQCLTSYKTFKLGGAKTLKSILISAAVRLNPFSLPAIQNLTDSDNIELQKVGDELTCFFAIIPQTNSTFNFLISMLFSQMFEALYNEGAKIPNSRLNYHVRFLLDEFANIGKIPEFPQKISTCRKYNISTTIVLQSIAQIKTLYKDDYETIIGNCDTAICLGTNEQTTADYFSKKLGVSTIKVRNRSFSQSKSGGSFSINSSKRELMTPDEIMKLPFDECIVMMNHVDPFYDKKYALENHPQFHLTGDASDECLYDIKTDPQFWCANRSVEDLEKQFLEEAQKEEEKRNEDITYKPKTLEEVLEKVLINNPNEDGYFLIRDPEREKHKEGLFLPVLNKARNQISQCLENNYKTASILFNGEYMDESLVLPLINRLTREYNDKIEDLAVSCFGLTDSSYKCQAAAKNEDSNIVKVIERMTLLCDKKEALDENDFTKYKIKESLSIEKFNDFRNGCEKGYQVIVTNPWGEDDY